MHVVPEKDIIFLEGGGLPTALIRGHRLHFQRDVFLLLKEKEKTMNQSQPWTQAYGHDLELNLTGLFFPLQVKTTFTFMLYFFRTKYNAFIHQQN